MNLAIDIGNTLIKIGVFEHQKLLCDDQWNPQEALKELKHLKLKYPGIQNCIYSASGDVENIVLSYISSEFNTFRLTHKTPINFLNTYQTPETLGLDRIALVSGAQHLYPNKNVLIIDAGTCITIDLKTSDGFYAGGNISPGIQMRLKALHHFTAKLPLVEFNPPSTFPLGKNTTDAILNGVINSVIYEIDEYISRYKSEYTDLTVILTGGDKQYLSANLKSSIFADSTFQLFGLHAILENLLND